MAHRLLVLLAVAATAVLVAAAPAPAALAGEVSAGHGLALELQRGTVSCRSLSSSDLEHLGEYVMERMIGSRTAHAAMNARMDAMLGSRNADRMHQALGRRYAGCPAAHRNGSGAGMMGTGAMMGGGSTGASGWPAMMGPRYAWLRGDIWRGMSRADWRHAGTSMMGVGWMIGGGGGWNPAATIGVVLGALAVGVAIVALLLRRGRGGRAAHGY